MSHSVILSARRTPIGRFMGGLSRVASPNLGSMVVKAALEEVAGECSIGCIPRTHC